MRIYPFSEVITDATSKFRKIKASDYKTEGLFKIIDQGQKEVAGYTDDESLINRTHLPIIVFGDHTRALKYKDSPIALGADGAKALSVNPALANALYVYYYLRTINLKEAGYSRHFKFLKQVEIPIPEKDGEPDFDDQMRIAHLLGNVEGLIAQRKHHLQQLDDLIKSVFLEMFGDPVRNDKGWESLPFHKVGKFISGGTPSKGIVDFWIGSFPWVSPKDMKVSKIEDAVDHISETVFEETSLRRIAPGHLLIVVRGMILAHSFPVAINTVEIAINQDMKAIKPIKEMNVVYLQHCLTSLKRQILKLISTAGHGTRKFDSVAMQKLFIPKPPEDLQNQFATIVEKVEGIKSRYQQSLTDLETLYGALSQKAFKGELDLSRIPLPLERMDTIIEEKHQADERVGILSAVELPNPENLAKLATAEGRKALIVQWAKAWIQQLGTFSVQHFMETAQQRLWDLVDTQDQDSSSLEHDDIQFGLVEYDELKAWVFDALEQGRLTQDYDDTRNQVQVTCAKG